MSSNSSQGRRKTTQFQNWVFTYFPPQRATPDSTVDDVQRTIILGFEALVRNPHFPPEFAPIAKRLIFSLERCPSTQRLHYQGAIRFKSRVTMAAIQRLPIWQGAHWEIMEGKWSDSETYCSKLDTHVAGPVKCGYPAADAPRDVRYWFGVPCNGKSREARALAASLGYEVYELSKADASNGTWLGDYDGEECVIMDEVSEDWFSPSMWKKMLDRLPQRIPTGSGGKSVMFSPLLIIMISNYAPPQLFMSEAFQTRISEIRFIDRPPYPVPQTRIVGFDPGCIPDQFVAPSRKRKHY